MIGTLATLLAFQLGGEVLAFALHLPIPGPVLGMGLLLGYLLLSGEAAARLRGPSLELLKHLSLLFVPAGVGIMLHGERLAAEWLPIAAALVFGTALAIAATALTIAGVARLLARGEGRSDDAAPE